MHGIVRDNQAQIEKMYAIVYKWGLNVALMYTDLSLTGVPPKSPRVLSAANGFGPLPMVLSPSDLVEPHVRGCFLWNNRQ